MLPVSEQLTGSATAIVIALGGALLVLETLWLYIPLRRHARAQRRAAKSHSGTRAKAA